MSAVRPRPRDDLRDLTAGLARDDEEARQGKQGDAAGHGIAGDQVEAREIGDQLQHCADVNVLEVERELLAHIAELLAPRLLLLLLGLWLVALTACSSYLVLKRTIRAAFSTWFRSLITALPSYRHLL